MNSKNIYTLLLFLFAYFSNYAQEVKNYYLVGKNLSSLVPINKVTKSDGSLSLSFENEDLNNYLIKKKILKYEKSFPNISNSYLQKVYTITIEGTSNLNELSVFNNYIEKCEEFHEGELASHPNDYMLYSMTTGLERNNYLDLIRAPLAWSITQGDPNILIGVADSYFTYSHEDLNNKLIDIIGPNNHSNLGHGTSVAYLAAGDTDNGKGGSSIGYKTRMVGYGSGLTSSAVYQLSQYPGIKVINMSWTTISYTSVEDTLYKHIHEDLNILLVAAAGNRQCGGQFAYCYPASYNSVLSVTGVGSRFYRGINDPNWGIYGWEDIPEVIIGDTSSTMNINDKVDISAPAYGLYKAQNSTLQGDFTGYNDWGEGTSGAAPLVSGTGALVFAAKPDITAPQVKQILKETTDNIYHLSQNQSYIGKLGTGRVNAFRAVMAAKCLDSINGSLDLMIRDNYDDYGQEPNNSTSDLYESIDIWIRNQPDGKDIRDSENPNFLNNNSKAYVYVRVTNKSCVPSTGNEKIKLYWAKASTSLNWPNNWNGSTFLAGKPMGGEIAELTIPSLKPGEDTIIEFVWNNIPNPSIYEGINNEPWHFCLLSRIISTEDPMSSPETQYIADNTKNNNNIAWKNISIINVNGTSTDLSQGAVIMVGNPFSKNKKMKLKFFKDLKEIGNPIFKEAEVRIKLDNTLLNSINASTQLVNIERTREPNVFIIKEDNAYIDGINLKPNEMGTLYLNFNFLSKEVTQKNTFNYKVTQFDEENKLLGGETYIINKKFNRDINATISSNNVNNNVELSANNIYNNVLYNWYNSTGNLIYSGPSDMILVDNISEKYKLEIISTIDGFKDYAEINIIQNTSNDLSIYPNPTNSVLNVDYDLQGGSGYLNITKIDNSVSNNYILNNMNNTIEIDVSNYSNGYYNVAVVKNGNVYKSAIFIKN